MAGINGVPEGVIEIPEFKYTEFTAATQETTPFGVVDEYSMNERFVHAPENEMATGYLSATPEELEQANTNLFLTGVKSDIEVEENAPEPINFEEMSEEIIDQPLGYAPPRMERIAPGEAGHSDALVDLVAVHGVTSTEAEIVLDGPPKKKKGLFGRKN